MAKKPKLTKDQKRKVYNWWRDNVQTKHWVNPHESFSGIREYESGRTAIYDIIEDKFQGIRGRTKSGELSDVAKELVGEAQNKFGEAVVKMPESTRKKLGLPPKQQILKGAGLSDERIKNIQSWAKQEMERGGYKKKMSLGGWVDETLGIDESSFLSDVTDIGGDLATHAADFQMGMFGAGDVIQDDDYATQAGGEISDVSSKYVAPAAGTVAATVAGGPIAGSAMGSVQKGIGSATPNEARQEQLQQQKEQREYAQKVQDFQAQRSSDARTSLNYTPVFEQGGFMGQGMTRQEGDLLTQFNGPTHENGGIDIGVAEVEGGETELDPMDYVFSDDIKNPDSGNTFADDSKKIDKRYGKRGDSDPLVYRAKNRELKELMKAQEKKKGDDQQREMEKGGYKKQDGGYMGFQEGFDFGDVMQYAPLAATAGQTLATAFSDTDIAETPRMEGQYSSEQVSPRPYMRDVSEQFDQARTNIRRGARTPGQYMSGMLQTSAEEAKARGDVMRQIDEQNRAVRQKANYWDYLTEKQNIQAEQQDRTRQLQAEARKRNMLRQGLSRLGTQAGQVVGDVRRQQAQGRYNQRFIDVLSGMYPDLELGPNDLNWIMKTLRSKDMPQEEVESIDDIGSGETYDLIDSYGNFS